MICECGNIATINLSSTLGWDKNYCASCALDTLGDQMFQVVNSKQIIRVGSAT